MAVQDVFNCDDFVPSVVMQFIFPSISNVNISRIIHSFDIDICACAFDSKRVLISFGCLQALNTGFTTYCAMSDNETDMMKRVYRLRKYIRRGYNILFPKNCDINTFINTTIRNCDQNQTETSLIFCKKYFGNNYDFYRMQKQFCEHYGLL